MSENNENDVLGKVNFSSFFRKKGKAKKNSYDMVRKKIEKKSLLEEKPRKWWF